MQQIFKVNVYTQQSTLYIESYTYCNIMR